MLGRLGETRLIFLEELRRSVRRRGWVIITLLVPGLLLLLVAVVPIIRNIADRPPEDEPKPTGLISLSEHVSFGLGLLPEFVLFSDRETGLAALSAGDIKEYFLVPEDYLESGRIEWVHTGQGLFGGFDPGPDGTISATVSILVQRSLVFEQIPNDILSRALVPAVFQQVRVGPDGQPVELDRAREISQFLVTIVLTVLLLFLIATGASSLVTAVAEEKETRMIEVILTSATPLSVMAGKVLAIGLGSLIQMVIWAVSIFLLLPIVFEAIPNIDLSLDISIMVWVTGFFLAGYFVSAVIMAGIGATSTGVREATQVAGITIVPLLIPIYAFVLIASEPNGVLSRVLSFIPFTAPTAMMIRLGVEPPSLLEVFASLLIIVLTGIALLWASARIFRAGLLMYGQRLGPRRIWAALREAS